MSRIGKKPVTIPGGVTANIEGGQLSVKGPKGTLAMGLSDLVTYSVEDGAISVQPANDGKAARSHWGMQRTLVSNLVEGVRAPPMRRRSKDEKTCPSAFSSARSPRTRPTRP